MRTPDVVQVSRLTVWPRSAHNPMVAQSEIPVTIPRIGALEAALQWVIPLNVSSHALAKCRRKEPGDHRKPARRHGADHRRLKRYTACNRTGFCPAQCQLGKNHATLAFWRTRSEELPQVQAREVRLLCIQVDGMVRSQDGVFWHSHHTPISRIDPLLTIEGEKGRVG
jgi:hypothetical protein